MGAHTSCFDAFTTMQNSKLTLGSLPDKYCLGKELGKGSFGIVFCCCCKLTTQEFAVKRVDKSRCSMASIDREVGMLMKLAHRYVVKLHEVHSNARSVDLVMDIFRGGDMVSATEFYFGSHGDIPMAAVQNLSLQMFRAIEWLHEKNVVHRDIKGDNFLLDRVDLEDPDCHVCLSDFGTAVELGPYERLQKRCGTKLYWAPEVYAKSYAFKVDVWAAGVITYCLMTRCFPFATKKQVHKKPVQVPPRCGEVGESFMREVLKCGEAERLSASEALEHPFLVLVDLASQSANSPAFWTDSQSRVQQSGSINIFGAEMSLLSACRRSEASTAASSRGPE